MEFHLDVLWQPASLVAIGTLTLLEIILGIDNILFISIISEKLPQAQRPRARVVGLAAALIFRIALLMAVSWLIGFTRPLFTFVGIAFSGKDLIMLGGGTFLLVKTISEIHHKMDAEEELGGSVRQTKARSFMGVIAMIILIDMVFSFDSILTAVGMVDELSIMVFAVIVAMVIMMVFVNRISDVINKHPSIQMLALSFLILIAFVLILDGLHKHIERGYVYFALFFSLLVEILNIRSKTNRQKTIKSESK